MEKVIYMDNTDNKRVVGEARDSIAIYLDHSLDEVVKLLDDTRSPLKKESLSNNQYTYSQKDGSVPLFYITSDILRDKYLPHEHDVEEFSGIRPRAWLYHGACDTKSDGIKSVLDYLDEKKVSYHAVKNPHGSKNKVIGSYSFQEE